MKKAQTAYDDACKAYEEAKAAADKAASPEITKPTETTPPSGSAQPAETTQPAGSPATGKDTPNKLHQASELEQRQASKCDRRQARKHRRPSAKRNRTSRNRHRRPRHNRHSHPPHQELRIAARAYRLRQSRTQKQKRPVSPRETGLFTCKNRRQRRRPLDHIATDAQATPASSTKHGIQFCSLRR